MSAELQQIAKALLQLDETLKMFHGSSGTDLKSIASMVSKGNEISEKKENTGYRAAMQVSKEQQAVKEDIKTKAESLQKSIDANSEGIRTNADNIQTLQEDVSDCKTALTNETLQLNFDNELTSEVIGTARFVPLIEVVFLNFTFKIEKLLSAGTHIIGSLPDKVPNFYTPLQTHIGDVQTGSAVIMEETGEIVITSETDIPIGTNINISGNYFSYQETEQGEET